MSYYIDGNRFDSLEDAVEHIIGDIPCDRSKILREYIGNLLHEIEQLKIAKELLKFWCNDFYDGFNNQIKYEQRHDALMKTEQFLKQV